MDAAQTETRETLASVRRAAGFESQQALAVAAGLAMRTVQRIEAGQLPSRESALALARALGMTSDALFELLGAGATKTAAAAIA